MLTGNGQIFVVQGRVRCNCDFGFLDDWQHPRFSVGCAVSCKSRKLILIEWRDKHSVVLK